jgi:hypothetical protein
MGMVISSGPLNDVLPDVRRKLLVANDPIDHRVRFAPRQSKWTIADLIHLNGHCMPLS